MLYLFVNRFQIGSLTGYYLFEHRLLSKRSLGPSRRHHIQLEKEPMVNSSLITPFITNLHVLAYSKWKQIVIITNLQNWTYMNVLDRYQLSFDAGREQV